MIWIETPSNPMLKLIDLARVAEAGRAIGAVTVADNTFASPYVQRPLEHGFDVVMHSATKYLNGHSDVIAGTLTGARDDEFWQKLVAGRSSGGAILGNMETYLLMRGMRTLHLRVERACSSALLVAEAMAKHPNIETVLYPGLPSHPGHAIAARQMTGGFGGMLSIRVKGGEDAAITTAARVEIWKRATSLGGVESLMEHRASIEGAGTPVPSDLLRLSVGIEDPQDLIDDLDQALTR
jgi:cystathionine gamma-synthase